MRFAIVFTGLLGVLLAPVFAGYNINIGNNGGGSGQQSVSVNMEHNLANVDNNNGWDSWHMLWDYQTGFAATRVFHKKACIVHRMNKDALPSLQALDVMVKEKKLQGEGPRGSSPKDLMYSINPNKLNNLEQFGKSIVGMCKGIPTYMAEEIQEASLFFYSGDCFSVNVLWIVNISLCGSTEDN